MNYKAICNLSYLLGKHDRELTSRISSQNLREKSYNNYAIRKNMDVQISPTLFKIV